MFYEKLVCSTVCIILFNLFNIYHCDIVLDHFTTDCTMLVNLFYGHLVYILCGNLVYFSAIYIVYIFCGNLAHISSNFWTTFFLGKSYFVLILTKMCGLY
jgi:hypothetical protein